MKKILILLLSLFLVCGCSNQKEDTKVENNDVPSYMDIINEGNYILLDVRSEMEYDSGHLVDSINIPYNEIDENIDLDIDKNIMVYCQSGYRASVAKDILEDLGYTVYNMGGYEDINLPKE